MPIQISVIQQYCYTGTSLRLTPPRSRKETLKSTLQNRAERPIAECMREKYTLFLATNLTTLLTLFKQLSMKNVWGHASSYFNGRSPHIAGTNEEWVHLGRSYERLSPLRQAIQTSSIAGLFRSHQGRIKTKLGLMLQPRKRPIFLSIGVSWRMFIGHLGLPQTKRHSRLACDTTWLYWTVNTVTYDYEYNNIKLSNIKLSDLLVRLCPLEKK